MSVSKTELGIQVMKDRSVNLSAQQRSALILCDGKRSAEDVVRMTAAVGVTLLDIQALVAHGLVDASESPIMATQNTLPKPAAQNEAAASVSQTAAVPASQDGLDFGVALNAAITLCSGLGFKGFGLNMSLTTVDSIEKLQKLAPDIRKAAGDFKYKPLHAIIFGTSL